MLKYHFVNEEIYTSKIMVKEKRNLYKCSFKINYFKVSYELIKFGFQAYKYLNRGRKQTYVP